jgi:hypothetical protein
VDAAQVFAHVPRLAPQAARLTQIIWIDVVSKGVSAKPRESEMREQKYAEEN